jgi:integrase
MIADVLKVYGEEVAVHRKSARNIGYHISNLLNWWGDKTAADVTIKNCRAYAGTKQTQGAAADLKYLGSALKHWDENPDYGPLKVRPKLWRPQANEPRDRYLTRSEAARLLKAARPYQHLRRMILLGLYTGSRPGVIMALTWDQVDLRGKMLNRLPAGAKPDAKKRAPKVRLGYRILAHLKRWKKMDGDEQAICRLVSVHNPRLTVVEDPHSAWAKVLKAAKLKGVTRHTLRHTRATWMMQAGVPIWEAAGFLGMTVKTLERVYGHHDPEHQERAANI